MAGQKERGGYYELLAHCDENDSSQRDGGSNAMLLFMSTPLTDCS
jgi:hypothetical protein